MKKIGFWTQDDGFPVYPGLENLKMIRSVPDDKDPMEWAKENGVITQDFGFYCHTDVTAEVARVQRLIGGLTNENV